MYGVAPLFLLACLIPMNKETPTHDSGGGTPQRDCGSNSLFLLLRLQGLDISLDQVKRRLGPLPPGGYSVSELVSASDSLGLELEALEYKHGKPRAEKNLIVYLLGARGGHFAVLNPVGTTGSMVQLIDPPYPPRIVDWERLLTAKEWTGIVIAPKPRSSSALGISMIALSAVASMIAARQWKMRAGTKANGFQG